MKQLIIFFLISSLFLSFVSHIQSTSGKEDEAADPMDPTAPNSAPFAMPDADGDDNVLTPATLLTIPEADAGAGDVDLPPALSPTLDPFAPGPSPGSGTGFINPNVVRACQATDNPVLCAETLRPFVDKQPEKAGDSFSLLEMEIMATQEAAQRALSASINPKNPDVDTLKHCKDVYVDALSNLKEALEAVPMKDFGKMKAKLSAAMTNLDTCDEGFEEINKGSSMEKFGGKLNKMVSNCLSMVASIKGENGGAEVEVVAEGPVAQGPRAEGPAQGPELAAEGPADSE